MQGRDDGDLDALLLQNLTGHIGRVGMRYGVVHMQQFNALVQYGVHHLAAQCQFVRLVLKQRIVLYIDFVVVDVLLEDVQADRLVVGNEVDRMSGRGHELAQFGCHDSAASIGGIADHANAKGSLAHR